jgi:hypothetical protein
MQLVVLQSSANLAQLVQNVLLVQLLQRPAQKELTHLPNHMYAMTAWQDTTAQ